MKETDLHFRTRKSVDAIQKLSDLAVFMSKMLAAGTPLSRDDLVVIQDFLEVGRILKSNLIIETNDNGASFETIGAALGLSGSNVTQIRDKGIRVKKTRQIAKSGAEDKIDILDRNLDEFTLTTRTRNCLRAENIFTMRQLVAKSFKEIKQVPNLGITSFSELKHFLWTHGLEFAK